jgi:hypothetical protein
MQITSKNFPNPWYSKPSLRNKFLYTDCSQSIIFKTVSTKYLYVLIRYFWHVLAGNKIRLKALHSITCVCICKCLLLVQTRDIWLLQNECYSEIYMLSVALFQSLSTLWVLCLISLARGNNYWSSGEVWLKILNYRTLAIASVHDVNLSFKYEIPISTHK